MFGYWGYSSGTTYPTARKTRANVQSWVYHYPSSYSYNKGWMGGPANPGLACMFLDGDSGYDGTETTSPTRWTTTGRMAGTLTSATVTLRSCPRARNRNTFTMIYLATDADP